MNFDLQRRTDECLIAASRQDPQAFDGIVERYQGLLQSFACRMLGGDRTSAEDVAVGAFLRLWENRFVVDAGIRPWLLRTIRRLCVDDIRRRRETSGIPESFPSQSDHVLADAVRDAVLSLPLGQREVLILSVYHGIDYREIAETLDIPMGTVASRKNAAIASLRQKLAGLVDS